MRLLVDKQGRPQGPYTVEEARALVLMGEISALDWAWPDGATQWIALKDVPGFTVGGAASAGCTAMASPVSFVSAAAAAPPLAPVTEETLWRGRPSQILNLRLYLTWGIILFGLGFATWIQPHLWPALVGLAALALVQIMLRILRLRAIEYVVTTQRVRVVSGLLNKNIQEIELFRVKDTLVYQWFIQRLFGLGTITILSGDVQSPRLLLHGVPNAIKLRERLRDEVMILRQRYNVRELDRM